MNTMETSGMNMSINALRRAITRGTITVREIIDHVYARIEAYPDHNIWIHVLPKEVVLEKIDALSRNADIKKSPLFGIPFAVKDNIDVSGIQTTAGCPAYAYEPVASAPVVKKLEDSGAILIGKTNLDQFATGLVGTRSPYGAVKNSFHPDYISGGSSSGSAVAVALGMVSFALGTDTAGSGRVPAGFNNIFGLKPTRNRIDTTGVVPACKSLDCVSIFALNTEDASQLLAIAGKQQRTTTPIVNSKFNYAVPDKESLRFSGNEEYERLYYEALTKLDKAGGKRIEIDFSPFRETAELLYEGPWVAERMAAIKDFFEEHSDDMLPVTRTIIATANKFSAVDTFRALYRLEELTSQAMNTMKGIDVLVVPTTPTIYTIDEISHDPVSLNRNLGYYTNFVNLLDLCALAVPNGFQKNGLPMGVTLIGRTDDEHTLLHIGKNFTR